MSTTLDFNNSDTPNEVAAKLGDADDAGELANARTALDVYSKSEAATDAQGALAGTAVQPAALVPQTVANATERKALTEMPDETPLVVGVSQIIQDDVPGVVWTLVAADATQDTSWIPHGGLSPRGLSSYSTDNFAVLSHRCDPDTYPEHTLGAMKAIGNRPEMNTIEMDIRLLSDGGLANIHNATTASIATPSATVSALDTEGFRSLYVDQDALIGSRISEGNQLYMLDDACKLYANKKILMSEVKVAGVASGIVDMYQSYGVMPDFGLVNSLNLSDLAPAVAAGYPAMVVSQSQTGVATQISNALAAGVTWATVNKDFSDETFEAWVASGIKTTAFTLLRRDEIQRFIDLGCVGVFSDDSIYMQARNPMSEHDEFSRATWMPGMIARDQLLTSEARGRFYSNGWGWDTNKTANEYRDIVLQGWACPVKNKIDADDFSIDFDMQHGPRSAATEWGCLAIADSAMVDRQFKNAGGTDENGYFFVMRANGNLEIFTSTDGVLANIATQSTSTVSVGNTNHYRVTVTPATVSLTRLASDGTVVGTASVANTAFRGGYFHLGRYKAAVIFSSIVIS